MASPNRDSGDITTGGFGGNNDDEWEEREKRALPTKLPEDLPTSLNDRRPADGLFVPETEMYDAWQGVYSSVHCEVKMSDERPRVCQLCFSGRNMAHGSESEGGKLTQK